MRKYLAIFILLFILWYLFYICFVFATKYMVVQQRLKVFCFLECVCMCVCARILFLL